MRPCWKGWTTENYLIWGERAAYSQNGEAVYEAPGKLKELKSYYGLVFQNFNLFPHYSVMKNICDAPVRVQKRDRKEVQEQAKVLLKKNGTGR